MVKILKLSTNKFKQYEFEARTGLNGQISLWVFPCILDQVKEKFYIWMDEVTIDKFTKSTFMNVAGFAEENGAKELVLVQKRDHPQKGTFQLLCSLFYIDQFKRLFHVLDA